MRLVEISQEERLQRRKDECIAVPVIVWVKPFDATYEECVACVVKFLEEGGFQIDLSVGH